VFGAEAAEGRFGPKVNFPLFAASTPWKQTSD
jgi:hypothetical protein